MIERKEILEYALTLPFSSSDCPFDEDFETVCIRHNKSKKWFGILLFAPNSKLNLAREGKSEILNLKCEEGLSELLRQNFSGILPAFHMNKKKWISVILSSSVPKEETLKLIKLSYELTKK